MKQVLVRVVASVPSHDLEIQGVLSMNVRKDEATDTYLGFMPALKLYAQGRTPEEAERLMERAAALYCETAAGEGQLWQILLARGFKSLSGGATPTQHLWIKRISGQPGKVGPGEPEMELEFAGAN